MSTTSSKRKPTATAKTASVSATGVLNFTTTTRDKIFYEVKPKKVPVPMNNEIHHGLFAGDETIPAMSIIGVFMPLSTWKIAAVDLPLHKAAIATSAATTAGVESKSSGIDETAEIAEAVEDQWAAALYPQLLKITTKRTLLESSDLTPKMDNLIPRRDFLRPQMTNSQGKSVKSLTKMTESQGYAMGLEVLKLKLRHNSFIRLPPVTEDAVDTKTNSTTVESKTETSIKTAKVAKYIERALFYLPSFLNHSCAHNCVFFPRTGILFSLCEINAGEELTISYATTGDYVSHSACPLPSCSCAVCQPRPSSKSKPKEDDKEKMLAKIVASLSSCHNCRAMPGNIKDVKIIGHGKSVKVAAENFEQCPKCHIARYCSAVCRKEHWRSSHKLVCDELRQV